MERVQAAPPNGNLVYADDTVVFDAFESISQTRWSFLNNNYADACQHVENLGLAYGRMRDFPLGPMKLKLPKSLSSGPSWWDPKRSVIPRRHGTARKKDSNIEQLKIFRVS
jgi:hypothetical protein